MNEFTDFKTYKMKNQKTYQYVFDYFSEQILSGEDVYKRQRVQSTVIRRRTKQWIYRFRRSESLESIHLNLLTVNVYINIMSANP